jgi:glycyl-tRNA synthetase
MDDRYDKLTAVCLKRGLFYPSSEIHNGPAGFFDYGSVGAKIKRNWENHWRQFFLKGLDEPCFEIDASTIMPEGVFRASGHLTDFVDPIAKCSKCGFSEKANQIIEEVLKESFEGMTPKELDAVIAKHNIKCPKCGGKFKETGVLGMMFDFTIGEDSKGYLRPETAQSSYVSFKREYSVNREKLPLGIAIIGRAYRNEISPRQGLFRMREFTQAELQIFFDPAKIDEHPKFKDMEKAKVTVVLAKARDKGEQEMSISELHKHGYQRMYLYYMAKMKEFYDTIGLKIRFFEKNDEERAFYNKYQFDGEVYFPSFNKHVEVLGLHYRTDHDLAGHQKISKQDMTVTREGKKILPHVIELSFGVDRNIFALLDNGFKSDEKRVYIHLPKQVAPYIAGIYPLVNKDGIDDKAKAIYDILKKKMDVFYDDGGSIGRRYARADEIGIYYGITIDYDSLKNEDVTIRDIETTKQIRKKIEDLPDFLYV